MSLIPEVKCRRCGERFSSLRSRCPNCGTRRVTQSSRTPSATPGTVGGTASYERAASNTRWQMIFGLILVVAVILAVIVMVSTSLNGTDVSVNPKTPAAAPTAAPDMPSAEPVPTPTPTPPPTVEVLQIRYNDTDLTGKDFTMSPGELVPINAYVSPLTITDKVKWTSEDKDEEYFTITVDKDDGNKITIECLKYSETPLNFYAEIFGKKVECKIYFRRA
jgi:predicted  nucleic acid-binding Zn-ribbon protein